MRKIKLCSRGPCEDKRRGHVPSASCRKPNSTGVISKNSWASLDPLHGPITAPTTPAQTEDHAAGPAPSLPPISLGSARGRARRTFAGQRRGRVGLHPARFACRFFACRVQVWKERVWLMTVILMIYRVRDKCARIYFAILPPVGTCAIYSLCIHYCA